ncbi:MAG: uncharacterized protein KVP18_002744 [Porospora cf. gigantea A]|uniref:uncharacterized protein n=1 Tax=Porospora cf. gigantea A TaxID=2853593 RepID=UPI00355A9FF8|nr:MAG: hypothetical protein KVP18_002744 [Porospora cf. gigantea A]
MAFRRCRIPTGRRAGLELRKQQLFLSEHKLVDVWYSSSQSFDLNEMVPKINLSEKGGDFVDLLWKPSERAGCACCVDDSGINYVCLFHPQADHSDIAFNVDPPVLKNRITLP